MIADIAQVKPAAAISQANINQTGPIYLTVGESRHINNVVADENVLVFNEL
ncbi:MAG: hypothetical protein PHX14_08465 [Syntrophomonadaceae bacterium]|nr:hypothetical protein [Syntrophomonadaceae bacterium]